MNQMRPGSYLPDSAVCWSLATPKYISEVSWMLFVQELEHVKRLNTRKEDEMQRGVAIERKRLPKSLRSETKTRTLMFKESLRISMVDPSDMSERMRQFDDAEKKRVRSVIAQLDAKHKRKLDQLRAQDDATLKELEHIQVLYQSPLINGKFPYSPMF